MPTAISLHVELSAIFNDFCLCTSTCTVRLSSYARSATARTNRTTIGARSTEFDGDAVVKMLGTRKVVLGG